MYVKHNVIIGMIDYDPGPYNVTIPAEVTSSLFNISVVTDNIVELEEEFELTIDEASLPAMISADESMIANVIILDNDSKLTTFCCQI